MERISLFDGTSTKNWKMKQDGSPCRWTVEDGVLHVAVGTDDIVCDETFGDAHLHLEWREPDMPDAVGQDKGNSGVYVHGCYEIQILDSYGVKDPKADDCGAIYSLFKPLVNACRPALEWQTYDIIFRAPRFNQYGEIKENPRMTVIQNGLVVHNNFVLPSVTPGGITDNKRVERGPLMLQDHGNPVSFRNVWVMPLDDEE